HQPDLPAARAGVLRPPVPLRARPRRHPRPRRRPPTLGPTPRPHFLISRSSFGSTARSPAHEFLGSRKLRLAPQDYSPWTPPSDRLSGRSYPPASRHPRVLDLVGSVGSALDECGATARAQATPASRGCGLATDQKAVRRRGPGRVVLG